MKIEPIFEHIELYLSYDYLPLEQQANILNSINGIYLAVAETFTPHPKLILPYIWRDWKRKVYSSNRKIAFVPPLCIDSAHTGESIKLKFSSQNPWCPDLEIEMPGWLSASIVVGLLLLNADSYYLDRENKTLVNEKTQLEIQKLKKEMDDMKSKNPSAYYKINTNVNLFYQEINEANINTVKINEHTVKESKGDGLTKP